MHISKNVRSAYNVSSCLFIVNWKTFDFKDGATENRVIARNVLRDVFTATRQEPRKVFPCGEFNRLGDIWI